MLGVGGLTVNICVHFLPGSQHKYSHHHDAPLPPARGRFAGPGRARPREASPQGSGERGRGWAPGAAHGLEKGFDCKQRRDGAAYIYF